MLLVVMKTAVLNFCLLGNIYGSFGHLLSHLPSQCLVIVRCWYLSIRHFFLKTTQLISKGFFHWHDVSVIKYTIVKLQNPGAFNLSKPEKLKKTHIAFRALFLIEETICIPPKITRFLDFFKLILLWLPSVQLKRACRQLHKSDYMWTW